METELLTKALEGDTKLFNELLEHFPHDLIQDEVGFLSKAYQAKYKTLERKWHEAHKPTFNPENPYYDLSLLRDGDRVTCKHSPELGIGTVEIKFIDAPNFPHTLVLVHFDCGVTDCYYPNQLERA